MVVLNLYPHGLFSLLVIKSQYVIEKLIRIRHRAQHKSLYIPQKTAKVRVPHRRPADFY